MKSIVTFIASAWLVAAQVAFAAEEVPLARLETNLGSITIRLFPAQAPKTVANFNALVESGFYDGLIFHRVLPGFMIQAGGYTPDMSYRAAPRQVPNESLNGLKNKFGFVSMARLSDPNSADSQFFINLADNSHIDAIENKPGYTVFGKVVSGIDVVKQIGKVPTTARAGMAAVPVTPVKVLSAELVDTGTSHEPRSREPFSTGETDDQSSASAQSNDEPRQLRVADSSVVLELDPALSPVLQRCYRDRSHTEFAFTVRDLSNVEKAEIAEPAGLLFGDGEIWPGSYRRQGMNMRFDWQGGTYALVFDGNLARYFDFRMADEDGRAKSRMSYYCVENQDR